MRHMPKALLLTALTGLTGCASAYHDYPCGCVPLSYCPEPPLPFRSYQGCPTPIAACYLNSRGAPLPNDDPQAVERVPE